MSFHLLDRSGLGIVLVILLVAFVAVAECMGPPATTSGQSSFDKALSNITGNPRYAHASWGLMVADPATGKTLYEKIHRNCLIRPRQPSSSLQLPCLKHLALTTGS